MRGMFILDAGQMRRVDDRAEREHGIHATVLMDNAGREVAAFLMASRPDLAARRALILCGKGNNGGDGIMAASHLLSFGIRARVALLVDGATLTGAAAWALRTAREAGVKVEELAEEAAWTSLRRTIPEHDLIVDALLGTGLSGPAKGRIREAIEAINASGCEVISVDVPSGISGSSPEVPGPAVEADVTLALAAPKIAHIFPPACAAAGRVEVLDIGIPLAAIEQEKPGLVLADRRFVSKLIPARARDTHKGGYGHVLILAGSRGKSGAAALMARACLRSGAGLVTVATPASVQPLIAAAVPEAMTEPLPESPDGGLAAEALPIVLELLGSRDVLAAGPGLGTGAGTAAVIRHLAATSALPMILDADALNVLAADKGTVSRLASSSVITPHPGEAARLRGGSAAAVQADRCGTARDLARAWGCTVILKGFRSLVAAPGEALRVIPTGNPGMATAGSGDALAGIVAAWLAQGLEPLDAATLAAHVHGLAGDLAAGAKGEISLIAGDLIEALPEAYRTLAAPDFR